MNRLAKVVARLEGSLAPPGASAAPCSCPWAEAKRRIEHLHPNDREARYRQAMDGLAIRLKTKLAGSAPSTEAELREQLVDGRRRLVHWSRPDSELGVCGTCRQPDHERRMASLQIRAAELLLEQLVGKG
jgi:hypothetical protein